MPTSTRADAPATSCIRRACASRRLVSLVWAGIVAAWALVTALSAQPHFGSIAIDTAPVVLDPRNPSMTMLGDFRFAGGVAIRSRDTDQMHELSDLVMMSSDRFIAVGDAGARLDARLLFDAGGRLTGVTNALLTPLSGLDGQPVHGDDRDAEGLALLPNGDLLVSFEGNHRVWRYPKAGDRALPAPWPHASFPINAGMEAITEYPDAGDDAYLVGAEGTGETWSCRASAGCIKDRTVDKPTEFGLVAMTGLPGGLVAYLLRAYDPIQLSRITLKIMRGGTVVSRMDLAPPLTVDNFEGLASWPGTDGRRRFYLISDDNDRSSQRTLLFAFDWQMPTGNK